MAELIKISIIDDLLDEKFWSIIPTSSYMSGHMYRGSAFETDDSCGNCDGARCEYCREITVPPHFESSITVDILEELLIKNGVPEEDASNIVYNDYGYNKSGNYYLHWPDEFELKEKHKDFYDKLLTPDEKLWKEFDSYYDAGLKPMTEVRNKRNLKWYSHDNHLENQYILWEDNKNGRNYNY